VFSQICSACHKPDASGLVGPSLVDPYWKYGHSDAELFQTVMEGRPGGMPAWGAQLGSDRVWRVLAYLETLPKSPTPGVGAPGYAAPTPPAAPGG
jgi:cytochrome c oxidase cbb3-type subunit 3